MNKNKSKRGLRRSILFATSVFTILVGIIVTASSYFIYIRYMENSITASAETNMKFLADYIDNELDNVDQLVTYCRSSSTIDAFISKDANSNANRIKAYNILNEYCTNNASVKYLHRVVITNLYGSYIQIVAPAYSSTIDVADTLEEQSFYSTLTQSGYTDYTIGFSQDPFYPRKTLTIVPILKPISYKFNSDLGGYIFIEVDDNLFLDAFANSDNENIGQLLLTLGDTTYVYEDSSFKALDSPLSETEYTIISQPLSKEGCSVALAIPMRQATQTRTIFYVMLLIVFTMLIILSAFLNKVLDYMISSPVDKIRTKLQKISQGDFNRDSSIEWNHELGDVGRGVNDLAESVSALIDTRIENEKQKKDLEYKMLQSQINPHFLYNTLNSIKFMAAAQGATGISDMTTALSRLLRSISKGTKLLIPIKEELALVEDYFTIQKYRYGGTINLTKTLDDDSLLDCLIIKFTMQPLVENAIFHGIEPTGSSGTIDIHIYEENELLKIDIKDDGVGMSKEQAERILIDDGSSPSEFFKEIGVSNVHKRLQYEFGPDYGITVASKPGEYTIMTITLPKRYE